MRLPVFGRDHRIVAVFLFLLVAGGVLFTGGVVANHTNAEPSGALEGKVVNANGEGIDDATVDLTDYPSHLQVKTQSDGSYRIPDVPYEPQDVSITHPDYKETTTTISVSTTNPPVTEDFELERETRNITGTVNSTGSVIGDRVSGVTIEVTHDNGIDDRLIESSDDLPEQVTTNGSGMYEIEVPTGDVELTARQDGFDSKTVDVSGNERDIDIDPILADVSGTVENTEGDAISNADVSVSVPGPWPARTATTDSQGRYTVTDVPGDGTRTVSATADNFQSDSEPVDIDDRGTNPPDTTLTLEQDPGRFELTVTDTHGNPLNKIDVAVAGVDQDQTETRPGGIYSEDLPFGTHEITVSHPDYREKTLDPIEIEQGEPKSESVEIERKETEPVAFSVGDVTPGFWQSGDEVTVDFSFGEEVTDTVELTVEGPTNDPETILSRTFSTGFDSDYEDQTTFTVPEGIQDGTYTVGLSALNESTSRTVDVSNAYDAEGVEFSETEYYAPAGDFVEVSVSGGDTGSTYVMIGGDRDADGGNRENYFDILRVSGGGSFIINTRLVGTDRPSEDVYIPVGGSVTSYAHDLGAENETSGPFEDVTFEDENGNQIASTLAEFRQEIGQAPRGSPLQVGRYQLTAGATGTVIERDGVPDFRHPTAQSNLVLTQPQVGDVTTYTLPPGPADQADQFSEGGDGVDVGSLLSEATETDQITKGDRILIEVQASGMYGALFDTDASDQAAVGDGGGTENIPPSMMKRLLDRHEGVHFELTTNDLAAPNHPGADLRLTNVKSSDLYILPDDTADQWNNSEALGADPVVGGFYVVINTRGNDPFNGRPRDGDELTVDFAYESPPDSRYQYKDYSLAAGDQPDPFDPAVDPVDGVEHFPYFGASTTTNSSSDSFVFEEPFIDYDETTLDGELIVGAESDGFIRGQTNLAPGSTATIQLTASNRPDPKLMTIENVEIDEDRAFDVTADFSDLNPGERVEVEFYSEGRLAENRVIDRRGVRVVENLDNPATFEIANLTGAVTAERGQQLGEIETTIVNTGDIADRQLVEFTIDGRTVRNQSVVLDSGEETTLSLSEQFVVLSPGEYTYTVSTEDDEQTGQLTVTGSENTEISSVESSDPTVNEQPEENDDEEEPPGIFGMVGLQRRDVAVAAAVTGAMHVLGQWT